MMSGFEGGVFEVVKVVNVNVVEPAGEIPTNVGVEVIKVIFDELAY